MEKNFKINYLNRQIIKLFVLYFKKHNIFNQNCIFIKKNFVIFNQLQRKKCFVYNGNKFKFLNIKSFYLGLKIGSFVFTRKPFYYVLKHDKKKIKR